MQEDKFRKWLSEGGANTEKGLDTRIYAVKTIERQLGALGFDWQDLDQAWKDGGFDQIRDRLNRIREDAKSGGEDFRILFPKSEKPLGRLSSWRSWLAQYGRYLAGDPPGQARDADRIRLYVLEHYIETARERGDVAVDILVRDVNEALGLYQAWPNICQAISGPIFQEIAEVTEPERIGANQSSATIFRFHLNDAMINRAVLEQMRTVFLKECPDFRKFSDPGGGWAKREGDYKVAASKKVQQARRQSTEEIEFGQQVYEILKNAAPDGPLVRWQTEDSVRKIDNDLLADLYSAVGRLVRSEEPIDLALAEAFRELEQLRARGATTLTFGERINILTSAAAMARPSEVAPFKITAINGAWKALTGAPLFVESKFDAMRDYARLKSGFEEMLAVMRDDWGWEPQNWLDVQGFLWIAMEGGSEFNAMPKEVSNPEPAAHHSPAPTNLILYGPPGTGKTYATAGEALKLCGEIVQEGRAQVMAAYARLCAEKRIEFVTFHQSMSYEDFVEGRQPMTNEAGDESNGTGFRLETVPGVFRRIARRAEASKGGTRDDHRITLQGRQVFKMSLGEAANPDDAHLFDDAIEGGYAIFGFEDIDWSDPKFSDPNEILAACRQFGEREGPVTRQSGQVKLTDAFRNKLKVGDIIIVSKGNKLFRAIGEVTGEYERHGREEGDYGHRRAVRWLWIDDAGVAAEEIYKANFIQPTIYRLKRDFLNIPALERYANSQLENGDSDPEQFVLIIDEINRANISKVFGELITLLEPDKRLGQPNQIKVRLPYSGDDFGVPSNLHILGTMNTADRSIALLDTALRRRFEFRELMPEPVFLADAAQQCGIDLTRLLQALNDRIEYLYDREHQIGHAYFIQCKTKAAVDAVMRDRIIPLLAEYFFEDWAKVAAVLGDADLADGEINGGFLKRTRLKAPPGMEDDEDAVRFRWSVRSGPFSYDKLLST